MTAVFPVRHACLWTALLFILLFPPVSAAGRTIVLGFDGLDPKLTGRWMEEGILPNFLRLSEQGSYQTLGTTNPAQSPVAWASFATGLSPGGHGIFDFIRRDAATYMPDFSIAEVRQPERHIDLFGYRIPLGEAVVENRRVGKPFWISAEQRGQLSSVLRVPVTYPPDRIHRMLAGMGVPDLLGSQGTFTLYTTQFVDRLSTGGRLVRVRPVDGRVETKFEGPAHPLSSTQDALGLPLTMERQDEDRVSISLGETSLELGEGEWSDWIPVSFGFAGVLSVDGMVRLHLVKGFPRPRLYVSPINIDPRNPAVALSAPEEYAAELAARIGPYHTLGMPEETWSLNERRIDDDAYLDMVETVLAEREAMFFDTLDRQDSDLVVTVFVQTDRVSHMFWRGLDPQHPLHAETSERGKNAIRWIYREADRILGETLLRMRPDDRLIVLSDHGFSDFRRMVHLNRWLIEQGYLNLKPGARESAVAFADVDWRRTRAYAVGLNGIFFNLKGREAQGIVGAGDAAALKQEIRSRLSLLRDPETGGAVISEVFDAGDIYQGKLTADAPDLVIGYSAGFRASWQTVLGAAPRPLIEINGDKWSGDHCIAPAAVPGVLFTSFEPSTPLTSIDQVSRLVLDELPSQDSLPRWNEHPEPGLFDRANPLFDLMRALFAGWLPVFLQLLLWSLLGAMLSMGLYRLLSNQRRLKILRPEIISARRELAAYDGEFAGLWPLIGRNYRLAGIQLWLTFFPAVLSSLPLLFLLAWVSNHYDLRLPEVGDEVEIRAYASPGLRISTLQWLGTPQPEPGAQGERNHWKAHWPHGDKPLTLKEHDGVELLRLPFTEPVASIHQPLWWNRMFGNPLGYLPQPGVVERLELELPRIEVLGFGPQWMRSWYFSFFGGLIVFSLGLKYYWRLH